MPRTPLDEPAAIVGKAKRMIDRLKSHYDLGRQLQKRTNTLSTEQFAKKTKTIYRTMRSYRAFAEHYTPTEFRELCELRRPNGLPLHWGCIPTLLSVERKGGKVARTRFQKLAATNGWTVPELQLAIQRKYPRKPGHGRKMKAPSTPMAGLEQLAVEAEIFGRRCQHIVEYLKGVPQVRRSKADRSRPQKVAKTLDRLTKETEGTANSIRRWGRRSG